jgi:hypothetical protein
VTLEFGFFFEAQLVYRDEPPVFVCKCCVFRQFWQLRRGGSPRTEGASWTRDVRGDGAEYGGGRTDDGGTAKPDDSTKEAGTYEDEGTGCIFGFEDTPTVGVPGPIDPYTVTWDYIGIVLDRCNNWALRAVRRFMVQRTVAITEGPNGSGYLVQDAPWGEGTGTARPGGWDHVGPLDQATAWKRAESGDPPPGRPRPAGELAPGQG